MALTLPRRVAVADASSRVEEVQRGPVVVVEGPPDGRVVVERDWEADVHVLHRATHVVEVLLEANSGVCTPITASLHGPLDAMRERTEACEAS